MTDTNRESTIAREVFNRFGDNYMRGHIEYMAKARELEDYYLGGGRQWDPQVKKELNDDGRPTYEVNQCLNSVNSAAGYQIANRVDASFVPRGGAADERMAKVNSKVLRQCLDYATYQDKETDCFLDGLIQQRGFIDVRMNYDMNDLGIPGIRLADPMDVVPDPDAREYDVDTWADIHEARWLTEAEIEFNHGRDAAKLVVANALQYADDTPFGSEHGIVRTGFNENFPPFYAMSRGYIGNAGPTRRFRVIEQQTNVYEPTLVVRYPTGDLRSVEGLPREYIGWLIDQGLPVFKRRMRRVRMRVVAPEVTIHDDFSPYDHITLVPYFPYFRRGRSIGMIDNQKSTQDMLNKFLSQYAHVVNGSANGGWQGEAGVLRNMTDEQFTEKGSQTGLILLREPGSKPFEKIQPNQIPTGLEKMIEFAHQSARVVVGVDETLSTMTDKEMSGVAIQSLQYAAQQKLAICLSNLSKTRRGVILRVFECMQKFMGGERVLRITEEDPAGNKVFTPLPLNVRMPDGTIFNDLTAGQYDLVISEQPAQVTFDNSQFEQIKTMKELGVPIRNARIIRASNLVDKSEIAEEVMQDEGAADPVNEAEAALKIAQARVADATAVAKNIEAQFSAIKTAREIVLTPQTAAIADALLRSGGFKDSDAAPIVPAAPDGITLPALPSPENSHPQFPPNPQAGLDAGLETGLDATT